MGNFIQVALPLPLERTFTYSYPGELQSRARPGCRAIVPFGRQTLMGVVIPAKVDNAEQGRVREVLDLPDAEPLLSTELLDFTRWLSEYYFCSWGEAIKAALPAGLLQPGLRRVRLLDKNLLSSHLPTRSERKILGFLRQRGECSLSLLEEAVPRANLRQHLHRLEALKLIALEEALPRTDSSLSQTIISTAGNFTPEEFITLADRLQRKAPHQARILRVIASRNQDWPIQDLLTQAKASRTALNALLKEGYLKKSEIQVKRYPAFEAFSTQDQSPLPQPNADQARALAAIALALEKGENHTFLLYGVTGSGKTLVYLKAIERALAAGGTALVLIPEISLTPQMVGRFRSHFGDKVALQHSALSPGERFDVWQGIRRGEFPLVLGARSALFAPLSHLKLIIVDEEGDSNFKQDEPNPRYNARDMALVRAQRAGAIAILGSATPSIESFYNAAQKRYTMLELPCRVDQVPAPSIRFCEPPKSPAKVLGRELERALIARFHRGEQTILLRNRRGFFTYALCASCGFLFRCAHCEISLTLHRAGLPRADLRCHICGYRTEPVKTCPECGRLIRYYGTGTQRLEEELAALIPAEKIARLDLDTTGRKGSHQRILAGFAREDYALLLGTKMVSRGHDFPKVTLVGVLSADAELAFPDFRSDERVFALLLQTAGRAGRAAHSESPGEVLIQTWTPNHPVLTLVQAGDYRALYEREIALRQSLHYPPFGWMVLFSFSALQEEKAQNAARQLLIRVGKNLPKTEWMGPAAAYRAKLKDRFRFQVIMKAPRLERAVNSETHQRLREIIAHLHQEIPATVHFTVDVDPIQLL